MKKLLLPLLIGLVTQYGLYGQESVLQRAYTSHWEVGGLFGNVVYDPNAQSSPKITERQTKKNLTLQAFNGLNLTSRLATGVTVGFDWYNDAMINPVALGARYSIVSRYNARLFATIDAGYGFTWFDKTLNDSRLQGGMMINPGIGWKLGKPGNAGFTITVSYKRQEAMLKMPTSDYILKQEEARQYNRLAVRLGIAL